jgi:hypothetical protein
MAAVCGAAAVWFGAPPYASASWPWRIRKLRSRGARGLEVQQCPLARQATAIAVNAPCAPSTRWHGTTIGVGVAATVQRDLLGGRRASAGDERARVADAQLASQSAVRRDVAVRQCLQRTPHATPERRAGEVELDLEGFALAGEVLLQLLADVTQRIRIMVGRVQDRRPFREVHRAQPGLPSHERQRAERAFVDAPCHGRHTP